MENPIFRHGEPVAAHIGLPHDFFDGTARLATVKQLGVGTFQAYITELEIMGDSGRAYASWQGLTEATSGSGVCLFAFGDPS